MSTKNNSVRNALRVIGPIFICLGIVLIVLGVANERDFEKHRDQQSREFMAGQRNIHDIDKGPPAGFFMTMGGVFAILIGLVLLAFSFQKAMARYQMRQYAPLLKEAIREVAPALAGGPVQKCSRCETENPTDARFCKQCGAPVGNMACAGCGANNEPDARFCNGCGKPL